MVITLHNKRNICIKTLAPCVKSEVLFHMHAHTDTCTVRGNNVPYFSPGLHQEHFSKYFGRVLPGTILYLSFAYLFTVQGAFTVPIAHNLLVVLLTFSHFSIISVFLLTEAHLIFSEVLLLNRQQYFT